MGKTGKPLTENSYFLLGRVVLGLQTGLPGKLPHEAALLPTPRTFPANFARVRVALPVKFWNGEVPLVGVGGRGVDKLIAGVDLLGGSRGRVAPPRRLGDKGRIGRYGEAEPSRRHQRFLLGGFFLLLQVQLLYLLLQLRLRGFVDFFAGEGECPVLKLQLFNQFSVVLQKLPPRLRWRHEVGGRRREGDFRKVRIKFGPDEGDLDQVQN